MYVEIICDTILRHYQIGRTFESSGSSALLLGLIGGSGMVLLIMILVGCAIAKRKQTTKNIPDLQRGKKQEQCQNTASHLIHMLCVVHFLILCIYWYLN